MRDDGGQRDERRRGSQLWHHNCQFTDLGRVVHSSGRRSGADEEGDREGLYGTYHWGGMSEHVCGAVSISVLSY